jgi:hypothetical protein
LRTRKEDSDRQEIARAVLVSEWDPIGISDQEEAGDEYDSYIPTIIKMIDDNATSE